MTAIKKNALFLLSLLLVFIGVYAFMYLQSVFSIILLMVGMVGIIILLNIPSAWIEDSFATISHRLKIPSLIAGGLFLAVASSSTEFFTSMSGVVWHQIFSIGFDTIVWSSLFNLCVIIGICTFYKSKLFISKSILTRDMPAYGVAIFLLLFFALDGVYSTTDFLLLIGFYILYVFVLYLDKSEPYKETTDDSWNLVYWKLFAGLLLIALLAHTMVSFGQQAVHIVERFYKYSLPIGLIACTIYGPGTSIADMFMSIAATKKGEDSAAIVNSISSNTFDLTICLGVPGLIYTAMTGKEIMIDLNSSMLLISMLVLSFFIVLFVLWDRSVSKTEGVALLVYYVGCTAVYLFNILG